MHAQSAFILDSSFYNDLVLASFFGQNESIEAMNRAQDGL